MSELVKKSLLFKLFRNPFMKETNDAHKINKSNDCIKNTLISCASYNFTYF
jgi:hypothetical protein